MSTFHSFISEPMPLEEAKKLYEKVKEEIGKSSYRNEVNRFTIYKFTDNFFAVIGMYKNLGNIPTELCNIPGRWATVSDEGDYYNDTL